MISKDVLKFLSVLVLIYTLDFAAVQTISIVLDVPPFFRQNSRYKLKWNKSFTNEIGNSLCSKEMLHIIPTRLFVFNHRNHDFIAVSSIEFQGGHLNFSIVYQSAALPWRWASRMCQIWAETTSPRFAGGPSQQEACKALRAPSHKVLPYGPWLRPRIKFHQCFVITA